MKTHVRVRKKRGIGEYNMLSEYKVVKKLASQQEKELERLRQCSLLVQKNKKQLTLREKIKLNIAAVDYCEVCEKICRDHGWENEDY